MLHRNQSETEWTIDTAKQYAYEEALDESRTTGSHTEGPCFVNGHRTVRVDKEILATDIGVSYVVECR